MEESDRVYSKAIEREPVASLTTLSTPIKQNGKR